MNKRRVKRLKRSVEGIKNNCAEHSSNVWQYMPIYPKDSFERFGDDLSEVLLSYLSFEDKFRFECLSKQCQRLVFNKQTELIFDSKLKEKVEKTDIFDQKYIEFNTMSQILKKCSEIRSVSLLFQIKSMDGFISLVIKHCLHLNSIEFGFHKMSKNTLKEICDKFGPKLKSITVRDKTTPIKTLLKCCPNLESLDIKDLERRLSIAFDIKRIPFVQKLKSFSFTYIPDNNKMMETFFEYNKNSLETIEVKMIYDMYYYSPKDFVYYSLQLSQSLSKLTKLKKLKFNLMSVVSPSLFAELYRMVRKCPNLIVFDLYFERVEYPFTNELSLLMNSFKQFKRVNISSFNNNYKHSEVVTTLWTHSLNSSEIFDSKHLTHLALNSLQILINPKFLHNIDNYLPKLESIKLIVEFITNIELNSLSKLRNLKSIVLKSIIEMKINKLFLMDLIIKCRKLSYISLGAEQQWIRLNDFQLSHLRQTNGFDLQINVYKDVNETEFPEPLL